MEVKLGGNNPALPAEAKPQSQGASTIMDCEQPLKNQAEVMAEVPPEEAEERTAKEIAFLLGVSDRQVRIYRQQLEWIYYWKKEALKSASGSYTQFALACLKDLQAKTSSSTPILDKEGNPVVDRKTKKVKRQRIKKQMDLETYAAQVWSKFRQQPNPIPFMPNPTPEAAELAEEQAEIPAEVVIPEVLSDDSPRSTRLAFPAYDQGTEILDTMDDVSAIASDSKATFAGLRQMMKMANRHMGRQNAAEDAQEYFLGYQEVSNEMWKEMAGQVNPMPQQQKQKTKAVRRTTEKVN